ncbi:hypothetical protein [Streptomyces sp. CA-106110]|uniref:hypothetical protein n=1 Tax=Streptomyces sp. CA-106110 TaxID=3240044 RepID=UPI003D8C3FD0
MPGHFTHIYTARRVADLLASGKFTDWPDMGKGSNAVKGYTPEYCGRIMCKWEKFTAIGAIGPDLFFFSMDWNNPILGPRSDDIMLALATYYFFDAAKEDHWEPLLDILQDVNSPMVSILRFLIKLQQKWKDFVAVWNGTIGPLVDAASEIIDDLTGGVLGEFKGALEQLLNEIEALGVEGITTYADLWGLMNTKIAKGWDEQSFLWSDMTHYRRTSATCQALVDQAERMRDGTDEGEERFEQFLAYAMGWIVHVGTDTIAHSFVNEQCGGPYRDHPTRHHLIENHIDAWNYAQSGEGGTIPADPWGKTDDYPELSSSALWFAVQLTPECPRGKQRPSPLSDDPDKRKKQLDVDGEMPKWMAEAITAALIHTFDHHPHPLIYQGDTYQRQIDQGKLTNVVKSVTGHGLDRPFQELLDAIAPPPPFPVPTGFPLPWEVATAYRLMITLYKQNFNGGWELPKPRVPDFVIIPPLSDLTDLFQPPDFTGIDLDSGILIEDVCDMFVALVQWIVKKIRDVIKLIGDLIKALLSPYTYGIRMRLHDIAMGVWDVTTKIHDVMAHCGILMPHAEARYEDNGELKWPNEIDLPLITLGGTVDGAFRQALADAGDAFGNLDQDQHVVVSHSVRDRNYPYYPVLQYHADGSEPDGSPLAPDDWEFRRPWAYPQFSETEQGGHNTPTPTPPETYDPSKCDPNGPSTKGGYKPLRPGPYTEGTTPDQVFFRTNGGFSAEYRHRYETAQTPWQTDQINEDALGTGPLGRSPLGDPVPFSAYLIGRLANRTNYATQFNLDADRAYAYLTWDWIRGMETDREDPGFTYALPVAAPWLDKNRWKKSFGNEPMQLHYVDPPPPPPPPPIGVVEEVPGAEDVPGGES